ncbi:hypothetical protein CALCODRAFT_503388 [Calocera cornea HHB12733]|uniref:Uncharacterized protein n=1 Tax=Calocera cornea HHB12733 TaxID=1353952 RepID=A0A165CWD1_9BASI|nr:hypothetical protein CALCODRAFT_503388 [Calocera cornea HHB12733]
MSLPGDFQERLSVTFSVVDRWHQWGRYARILGLGRYVELHGGSNHETYIECTVDEVDTMASRRHNRAVSVDMPSSTIEGYQVAFPPPPLRLVTSSRQGEVHQTVCYNEAVCVQHTYTGRPIVPSLWRSRELQSTFNPCHPRFQAMSSPHVCNCT